MEPSRLSAFSLHLSHSPLPHQSSTVTRSRRIIRASARPGRTSRRRRRCVDVGLPILLSLTTHRDRLSSLALLPATSPFCRAIASDILETLSDFQF
ncbi:unnamed protein product [Linum trigynum]|uniref:Uncharacterized protein n=1 Tax=Linum trigynum TaxID=586398 RepID=A0AAV2ELL9_9ROSI